MNIPSRSAFIAATMALIAVAPQAPWAQTPAQMEYERQQREYRQQQERQQQEQQRQQQLMNENARRQQEESRRLNAPMGQSQSPAPGYQGATPQRATPQSRPRIDATAETAAAKWEDLGSLPAFGGMQIYSDPITKRRSGELVKMWEMWDFKTPQLIDGKRLLSVKSQYEYDCKGSRVRMLATTGYAGHMGKGAAVGAGDVPAAWETVTSGNYKGQLFKVACAKS